MAADLVIGEDGAPTLRRRRASAAKAAVEQLAETLARQMPERSLLSTVSRTAHWQGWHHHFGPASCSDPKIKEPLDRYCVATFTGGVKLGPYEAAKHIAGVSARELSIVRNRHIDLKKLNAAIATVVNAFAELDVVKAWGDGTAVAADGIQVETYTDNLLAETSIRYGGHGVMIYWHVEKKSVCVYSQLKSCPASEVVAMIEGVLRHCTDASHDRQYTDTHGQNLVGFAHLLGSSCCAGRWPPSPRAWPR